MPLIRLILDNIRSSHNVGSILRSADAFGVSEVVTVGITPYPIIANDPRLPHLQQKTQAAIAKTALGAEKSTTVRHLPNLQAALSEARAADCRIYGLEQSRRSTALPQFVPEFPFVLILGNEVSGIASSTLDQLDAVVEIPQFGRKESLNVAVAAGIALYALTLKLPSK